MIKSSDSIGPRNVEMADKNKVLLTVSGTIDPDICNQIGRGERPQADYLAMSEAFNADILDYSEARKQTSLLGKWIEKIGGAELMLAWTCFQIRHKYQVFFTDGEQVGLPLALFFKFNRNRPCHLMITHILSVRKKMIFLDWFQVHRQIDTFFVYATWQKRFIEERWRIPSERVVWTPFMVDDEFFTPDQAGQVDLQLGLDDRPVICAVGLEFRDYPTLIAAVEGLNINVVIAAASPWSKRANNTQGKEVPSNVLIRRFTQFELRELYALSDFVVMPLEDVPFQAGVTAILEAMAMEKAIICSRTLGQTDIIVEGETGIYVSPGNPDALRDAIVYFQNNPDKVSKMGVAGRKLIQQRMNLKSYTTRLAEFVHLRT